MTAGSAPDLEGLPPPARSIFAEARRAVLCTVDAHGAPHAVPVCFVERAGEIVSPIDHKPKSGVVLARVRNIEATGRATLLVDRWDEEWPRLGWVMVIGSATVRGSSAEAEEMLADRYPQFRSMPHHDALIVVRPERILWWTYA